MSSSIKGKIASPGINIGKAYVHKGQEILIPKYYIDETNIGNELARFDDALDKTRIDILELQAQINTNINSNLADIFLSHLMVLEDPLVVQRVIDSIKKDRKNAEWVLDDVTLELIQSLNSIEDDYLRERIIDISDIHKRLITYLQKQTPTQNLSEITSPVILFAEDLTPSETAILDPEKVLAIVTDKGGITSHTAIMARALNIPAIVGTINGTAKVKNDDLVIVDAIHGMALLRPDQEKVQEYTSIAGNYSLMSNELKKLKENPAVTLDGTKIDLMANIELPKEIEIIKKNGAHGIGLFRTEFLFLGNKLPDEDTQFKKYKKVLENFSPSPVTIRTIDVGGDKITSFTKSFKENNPFLGCRAIRFSLLNEDIFRTQIRAILRSSIFGKLRLMFPMISTVEEIIQAKAIIEDEKEKLRKEDIPFDENLEIGMMLEVPSAIVNLDAFVKHVDFFSIGTNDLTQYTLAVDRINDRISYLYNPLNPAVLRLLKLAIDGCNEYKRPVSICGEIAGDVKFTMLLLGLGFRSLSLTSTFIPSVKKIVCNVTIKECEQLAEEILAQNLLEEIEEINMEKMINKFPDMLF